MSNAKLRKARADVKAELDRINAVRGGLRPSEVVSEAASKESPLHSEFEWDNKKAGHEYRLEQARRLIRIAVTVVSHSDGTTKLDPYIHVPATQAQRAATESNEGVYLPMSVVVQDADKYSRALTALMGKVRAATLAAEELRDAAAETEGDGSERLVKIAMAITALQTAGAAVAALH